MTITHDVLAAMGARIERLEAENTALRVAARDLAAVAMFCVEVADNEFGIDMANLETAAARTLAATGNTALTPTERAAAGGDLEAENAELRRRLAARNDRLESLQLELCHAEADRKDDGRW